MGLEQVRLRYATYIQKYVQNMYNHVLPWIPASVDSCQNPRQKICPFEIYIAMIYMEHDKGCNDKLLP